MQDTLALKRPLINVARGHNIRIDNKLNTTFTSNLREETIMRRIETERFEIRFTAETCRDLDLSWLLTKAYIPQGGGLRIMDSCRYTQNTVEECGAEYVIEKINEDRERMAEIIRSYLGVSDEWRVFEARVEVIHKSSDAVLGCDTLHQCIYNSYEEFCRGGGYASDMVGEAIKQARDAIADLSL